jgi:hypothetical protein
VLGFVPQREIVWEVAFIQRGTAVACTCSLWCAMVWLSLGLRPRFSAKLAGLPGNASVSRVCYLVRVRCVQPCASLVLFVSCVGRMMLLAAVVGLASVAAVAVGYSLGLGSCAPPLCMWDTCVGVVRAFGTVHGLCRVCKLAIAWSSSCAAACARVWLVFAVVCAAALLLTCWQVVEA